MSSILRRVGQSLLQRKPQPPSLMLRQQQRGFAADAEHGEAKVHFWQAPTHVSKWKEEEIVLVILGTWGVGIYSAFAIFGGKKEDKPAPAPAA